MGRNWHIFFLWIVLLFGSCDISSEEDQSLTEDQYKKIGMPDVDKMWSFEDYEEACEILSTLKTFRPSSLPKKGSKKSGAYFNRIIDPENLSFLMNENITLSERAKRIQAYIDIQGSLITSYTDLNSERQSYNRELIDLYIFGLTIAQNMLDLGQRINESVDEVDIDMQYAFRSVQHLYIKMVLFVLNNQSKTEFFEDHDLEKLAKYMSDSIILNIDWMGDEAKADIEIELQKVLRNTSSATIIDEYRTLIEII